MSPLGSIPSHTHIGTASPHGGALGVSFPSYSELLRRFGGALGRKCLRRPNRTMWRITPAGCAATRRDRCARLGRRFPRSAATVPEKGCSPCVTSRQPPGDPSELRSPRVVESVVPDAEIGPQLAKSGRLGAFSGQCCLTGASVDPTWSRCCQFCQTWLRRRPPSVRLGCMWAECRCPEQLLDNFWTLVRRLSDQLGARLHRRAYCTRLYNRSALLLVSV